MSSFDTLYHDTIAQYKWISMKGDTCQQSRDYVEDVPTPLRHIVSAKDVFPLKDHQIQRIEQALKDIVFWPSVVQAMKGFLTAGPLTSIRYGLRKLRKRWQS